MCQLSRLTRPFNIDYLRVDIETQGDMIEVTMKDTGPRAWQMIDKGSRCYNDYGCGHHQHHEGHLMRCATRF